MQFGARAARRCATKITHLMKKYITPNIETQNVTMLFALCDPSAGAGSTQSPGKPGDKGGPLGAPQRVF